MLRELSSCQQAERWKSSTGLARGQKSCENQGEKEDTGSCREAGRVCEGVKGDFFSVVLSMCARAPAVAQHYPNHPGFQGKHHWFGKKMPPCSTCLAITNRGATGEKGNINFQPWRRMAGRVGGQPISLPPYLSLTQALMKCHQTASST